MKHLPIILALSTLPVLFACTQNQTDPAPQPDNITTQTPTQSTQATPNEPVSVAPSTVPQADMATNVQVKLPFVGKRYFNLLMSNDAGFTIEIKDNGDTIIESLGKDSNTLVYQGKYQTDIPVTIDNNTSFYRIEGNKIYELDAQKLPVVGCNPQSRTDPCVSDLVGQ